MTKNNYELEILVNGKPIREYLKDGKSYAEGRRGNTFSLRIRNNSGSRVLAIPSIDGLSVMNGKEASYDSSGYIIKPYDSLTIDGWRTSDKEVAKFYFAGKDNSYAAKMDRDGNLGVVGLAIFGEKFDDMKALRDKIEQLEKNPKIVEKHIYHNDHHLGCWSRYCYSCNHYHCTCQSCIWSNTWVYTTTGGAGAVSGSAGTSGATGSLNFVASASLSNYSLNATPTSSMKGSSMNVVNSVQQELGTGWGESKRSEVKTVEFERASNPEAVFEIFYNTREQLENLGIDFSAKTVYVAPQAFPNQYCEAPRK